MWTIPAIATAKNAGYDQQISELRELLTAQWETANEVFMLFREQDPYYADPRTDFTLGRRTAIERLLAELNAIAPK